MAGGDGMGGLSAAILIAGLAIVSGAGLLFWLVARRLAGRGGRDRSRASIALLTLLGVALGCLVVVATFYESLLDPAPQVRLAVPPGYQGVRIFLLEDPERGLPLVWQGGGLFSGGRYAEVSVPASGVVRVRSLRPEEPGRAELDVVWGEGEGAQNGGGEGPPGTGARSYMIVERVDAWAHGPPPALPEDPAALGGYIVARERGDLRSKRNAS